MFQAISVSLKIHGLLMQRPSIPRPSTSITRNAPVMLLTQPLIFPELCEGTVAPATPAPTTALTPIAPAIHRFIPTP
jgi:hypothetical protein